ILKHATTKEDRHMRTWRRPIRISTPIQNLGMACGCTGILAMVLFPVFTTARHDHRPSCLSHIKQAGLGLLMYASDYDDRLPRAAEWMDADDPYVRNKDLFRCPNLKPRKSTDFGYAFNSLFATRAISDIKEPAKAILLYDSNDLCWNANA